MATIVKHKHTGESFVVVGAGYGAWHSKAPHALFGNLAPTSETGSHSLIAVTRADGELGWIESSALVVVSVDGKSPHQLLAGDGVYR